MSQCNIKRFSTTKYYLQNECLPTGYTDRIDITPYVESDIAGEYSDETTDGIKSNSRYMEEYVTSIGLDYTFSKKVKVGTFIAQYFALIDAEKKAGNLEVMNNFILTIEDPIKTEVFPLCYMELSNPPLQNIESKEYTIEFRIHPNGEPIISLNPNAEIFENPQTLDLNLTAVANGDSAFDLTFDTDALSISYNAMQIEMLKLGDDKPVQEVLVDGSSGTYTTTSAEIDTTSSYTITLKAVENGYSTQYVVGTFEYSGT